MLKKLSILAITGLSLSFYVHSDTLGIEVGAYQWTANYSGIIAADQNGQEGTELNIENDLGFDDEGHNIIWASFEHPIPFIPNFKVVSSSLASSASSTLTQSIVFGDETFSINENISTKMDLSNTEYTLYYEFLDNWINIDGGLTLRQYDGVISLRSEDSIISESEDVDFTIPLLYLKGRVDLPFTGFFVDGIVNVISFDGDSLSDTEIALGYESEIGLGGKAGYRTFSMEVEDSDFNADIEFSGAYVSVFYHF